MPPGPVQNSQEQSPSVPSLTLLPRLPASGTSWLPNDSDSVVSALSSQGRTGWGSLAGEQNPLAASGLAEVLSWGSTGRHKLVPPSAAL